MGGEFTANTGQIDPDLMALAHWEGEGAELLVGEATEHAKSVSRLIESFGYTCATLPHGAIVGRLAAITGRTYSRAELRNFFRAWNADPRVTKIEVGEMAYYYYEIAVTDNDRQKLDAITRVHRSVIAGLGGVERAYNASLGQALEKVLKSASKELPWQGLFWDEESERLIRQKTITDYWIRRRILSQPPLGTGACPPEGKRRDPRTEVPLGFPLHAAFKEATCEELRQIPWRLLSQAAADVKPAYETIGEAIDRFVARRSYLVSIHLRRWVENKIRGDQPINSTTAGALTACIFRDHRFTLLGCNTLANTVHRLDPPGAVDAENMHGHELMAQQIAAFLREKKLKGIYSAHLLAKAALEAMQIDPSEWHIWRLGNLLGIQKGMISCTNGETGEDCIELA